MNIVSEIFSKIGQNYDLDDTSIVEICKIVKRDYGIRMYVLSYTFTSYKKFGYKN